jgi:hypothetical protein
MLRMRGLLVAVAVLAALAGGVYWSKKAQEAEAKKPASDASAPKILDIPFAKLAKLEIRHAGGETVVAERKGNKWDLTVPKPLPADNASLNLMAEALTPLNADRLVEEKTADLGQYGLVTPSLEFIVTEADGARRHLLIGDEVPTGSGSYAKLEGDPRVFTITSHSKAGFDKTENDLRDRRLLTFASDKLTRVELTAKGQTIEFGKNNQNDWQILKPRPLRADGGLVEELIRKLQDAKMEPSTSEEDARKAAAAFWGGAQAAVVRVTDAVGTQQLQVRKDKAKDYYAKSSVVEGIYKVPSDVGDALDKGLEDFRTKKIFDFGWSDPSAIDLRDGVKSASYQRSGEKWASGGKQMDPATVQALIDKLRNLSATQFAEKGFSSPSIDLSVISNDGKRVEKVALSKTGSDWFAKRENEPTIYQLDANVVEELQKAMASVKEVPKKAAKK